MATWVEIDHGVVRLVYTPDDPYTPPEDHDNLEYVEITGSPVPEAGWTYEDSVFAAPPAPPVPEEPETPPPEDPPTVQELRDAAHLAINEEVAFARYRYTTPVVLQGAVYILKAEQAHAYQDAGYPTGSPLDDYPWIKEEAIGLEETPQAIADSIIATEALWAGVYGPAIERERLKGKHAVNDADNETDITTAKDAAITALQGI